MATYNSRAASCSMAFNVQLFKTRINIVIFLLFIYNFNYNTNNILKYHCFNIRFKHCLKVTSIINFIREKIFHACTVKQILIEFQPPLNDITLNLNALILLYNFIIELFAILKVDRLKVIINFNFYNSYLLHFLTIISKISHIFMCFHDFCGNRYVVLTA